ncbi:EAL domain-containing protein (putative c-di-GMP-specific phosphodiesterase class I) [Novosphingobium hassiacum]|uniref:EAL domain-containing protein (Putative c-di-GMP-specific phosphodiesterase class I) n=1 Tax=Novosphingobium hassiacum TaxID=173676 RepID=A0A7W6EY24_9SPHN|nr:EAL domain-containing protein [Novosphingobium hassiacum]MBB3862730.1 EAL domain-containing protein (putative c-di-GMP-specific phosphodiesterase class I) [Novosphingobium hassiacum]
MEDEGWRNMEGGAQAEQVGGNVHVLPLPARRFTESAALSCRLRIDNFPHIREAYGEDVARTVFTQLAVRMRDVLGAGGLVDPIPGGVIEFLIWCQSGKSGRSVAESVDWIRCLCADVPLQPVETLAGYIHVALSVEDLISVGSAPAATCVLDDVGVGFAGDPARSEDGWAGQYRSDMTMASPLLAALGGGGEGSEPVLAWQPVRDVDGVVGGEASGGVLYWEGCLRQIDRDGQVSSLESALGALERLGFIRLLDHRVVSMALDELDREPSDVTIAVNISARSAALDYLWEEAAGRLKRQPWLAQRLVVEITETSAIPNMGEAVRFVDRMRSLGCRIAIDDFGTGYASVRNVMALSPDFVKIDSFFLHYASHGEVQRGIFEHLAGLGWSLGATVIAEGVETEAQAALAARAGCHWQQGYFWGRPSFSRLRPLQADEGGNIAQGWLAPANRREAL